MADINTITNLIRKRRSIFPTSYIQKPILDDTIRTILENANWAPNHKHTEPWRFKIFRGTSKKRLGSFLKQWLMDNKPDTTDRKIKKAYDKCIQSDCVIAIVVHNDPEKRVPQWEELAAVACAVQNMWLSCTALDIGCYWSSPKAAIEGTTIFNLEKNEQCIGLFYMGYYNTDQVFESIRRPLDDKIEWFEE